MKRNDDKGAMTRDTSDPQPLNEAERDDENLYKPSKNDKQYMAADDADAAKAMGKAADKNSRKGTQASSSAITLKTILGGDILKAQVIRRQIWLMMLIAGFFMIYVANRYSCQQNLLEIDRLNNELKDAKFRYLSSNSLVTEKCRESHVLELLKDNKDSTLRIPSQPPYIIYVPENEQVR